MRSGFKTCLMMAICMLFIFPSIIYAEKSSSNEVNDATTVINKKMDEQFKELQQIPNLLVSSFTDERGYTGIKVTFFHNELFQGGISGPYKFVRTPLRNLSSSVISYPLTNLSIQAYSKNPQSALGKANVVKNYFIKDGIDSRRLRAEGNDNYDSTRDHIDITLRVSARMIEAAQSGTLK